MRLSAVVLNYRTPDKTVRAVRSLESSTRRCDDVIVVDNGSGDGSDGQLRRDLPTAAVMALPANLGFAGGCNAGIRQALTLGADLILLLNSDAELEPDALGILEAELVSRPEAGLIAPVILMRSQARTIESIGMSLSRWTGRVRLREYGEPLRREHHRVETVAAVTGCAMLIRRDVLERAGLLSQDYFFGFEDVDLCLTSMKMGRPVLVAGAAVARHDGHGSAGGLTPFVIEHSTFGHLLVLKRHLPLPAPLNALRGILVVGLGVLHAAAAAKGSRARAIVAVFRGARRYVRGRRS